MYYCVSYQWPTVWLGYQVRCQVFRDPCDKSVHHYWSSMCFFCVISFFLQLTQHISFSLNTCDLALLVYFVRFFLKEKGMWWYDGHVRCMTTTTRVLYHMSPPLYTCNCMPCTTIYVYLQHRIPHNIMTSTWKIKSAVHSSLLRLCNLMCKKKCWNSKLKKTGGPDDISPKLVRTCTNILIQPLFLLYNPCISSSTFPDDFKRAKIIPLHKQIQKIFVDNYQLISLLNCLSKILERPIHKLAINFLHKHALLYQDQFGFRENHSTTYVLIELINGIKNDIY